MPLRISDANILIDMECGSLLQATLKIAFRIEDGTAI